MSKIVYGSNRSFGVVFFIFFLIISFYPLINAENIRYWALFLSIIFLVLGLINAKILTPLNKLWFKFGLIIGKILTPLIMIFIFFAVVTPTGILIRLFKKNYFDLKYNDNNTYWIEKTEPKSKMKNQF
tara:strand:+ start:180 stop:563 length:384 start_codon:yes stop_codon:yes gene_type:complete